MKTYLVTFELTTTVSVNDTNLSEFELETQLCNAAKQKLIAKINNDELIENILSYNEDTEA